MSKYMLHGNEQLYYASTMWVTLYLSAYLIEPWTHIFLSIQKIVLLLHNYRS